MAECRSCGAPVEWVVTEQGKRMPLNLEPVQYGNIIVEAGVARYVPVGEGGDRVSHFATCPQSDEWRKQ